MDDSCKFCGTVPNASDPHSCSSYKEAVTVTAKWPGGCPWFDADSRKRFLRQSKAIPKGMAPVYVKQWRTIILVPNGVVERAKAALCCIPHDTTAPEADHG
jgi:hypothetical protein